MVAKCMFHMSHVMFHACTVHKVQGLTLDQVVASTELVKQRSFNYGQIYVALSRATSLQGLYILGEIASKHVKTNPKVLKEYERLRKECSVSHPNTTLQHDSDTVTITLLNIRSLKKHCIDIKSDSRLFTSDVIAFTETQLLSSDSDNEIIDTLSPFKLYRQDHVSDKYSSMAICTQNTVDIRDFEYFPSLNAVKYELVNNMSNGTQNVLLLYRKQNSNVSQYTECLRYILTTTTVDIVLGDFNINYFNDKQVEHLKLIMDSLNYLQIVTKPTFVSSGSLLDHVYIRSTAVEIIENDVLSVYYSDHDAVKVKLTII